MRIDWHGKPVPPWTVHSFYPVVNTVRFEYAEDGATDVTFEQDFGSEESSMVRRCSWNDAKDRAALRLQGAYLGLKIKTPQDLHLLAGLCNNPCFVLHGIDFGGNSIAVVVDDLSECGLNPRDAPDHGVAEAETVAYVSGE